MQAPLLTFLISDGVARAICWTLVHSLWEGVLAAVIAGLIMGCTRRLPAAMRYNLLTADLLLFLLVAGATFSCELKQGDLPKRTAATQLISEVGGKTAGGTASVGTAPGHLHQESFVQRAGDFLNTQATIVTLVWMACLILQLLRLTGGVYNLRRLRRNNNIPSGEGWEERLGVLAEQLGIKRTVTLLQSGLIKSPAAFGFLKPSILVPLGMLANLPPDQVEAVLLHELAHIRRGDYIRNLLLHFTEALFFFNPGLRWIAMLLRQERENCCDDMVVAATADRNSYFEALVAFAQFALDGRTTIRPSYVLQLGHRKTDLIGRIRRMMEQENRKLQTMEKTILSFALMVMVSLCLVSMKEKQREPQKLAEPLALKENSIAGYSSTKSALPTPANYAQIDTVPQWREIDSVGKKLTFTSVTSHSHEHNGLKKFQALATDDNGHRYEIRKVNGEVTEFKVNGKLIAKEDYGQFADVFDKIEAEQKGAARPLPPMKPMTPAAQSLPGTPTPLTTDARRLPSAPAPLTPSAAAPLTPGADPLPGAPTPSLPATAAPSPAAAAPPLPATAAPLRSGNATPKPLTPLTAMKPMESAALAESITKTEEAPTLSSPLVYTKSPNPVIRSIALDLIASHLIEHVDQYSFSLDADRLTVNGVKQSDDIYLKYKEKYIQYPKDHFIYSQYYTTRGSGSHSDVDTGP